MAFLGLKQTYRPTVSGAFFSGSPFTVGVTITPFAEYSIGVALKAASGSLAASNTFPTANMVLYFPFEISNPFTVAECFWLNGATITASVDVGVYNEGGTRLISTGSVAQSGANLPQSPATTDIVLSAPARYYLGLGFTNNTSTLFASLPAAGFLQAHGVAQEATGAGVLPSTATFAICTTAFVPLFGISSRTLV